MNDWLVELAALGQARSQRQDLDHHQGRAEACVLVSVVRTMGSCPREPGTRMLVTVQRCLGTIGGGHLEYQAIELARRLLQQPYPSVRIERFALGARLGQCCGGVVHLSFEVVPAEQPAWVRQLQAVRKSGELAWLVTPCTMGAFSASDRAFESPRSALVPTSEPVPTLRPTPGPASLPAATDKQHKLIITRNACHGRLPDVALQARAATTVRTLWNAHPMIAEPVLNEPAHVQPLQQVHWQAPLLFEPYQYVPPCIALFGAGHVGKALAQVLASLPCRVIWIDSREDVFPPALPANARVETDEHPADLIDSLPAGSHVLIMTHSHALDQAICERALRRQELPFCGLIGSNSKRARFEKRLLARGLPASGLRRLVCPIGIDGIDGKHPAEIAIAVAAQLLRSIQSQQSQQSQQSATRSPGRQRSSA